MPEQPYLTFSEDWRYAFVERTIITLTRARAFSWLDQRLCRRDLTTLPCVRAWRPERAAVLSLERWDEEDGVRLRRQILGSRDLWRIDVARALIVESERKSHGEWLVERLTKLHYGGRLAGRELARAKMLTDALEEAEVERQCRQALRPVHAPRAPLDPGAAAMLARLMLILTDAVGSRPDEYGEDLVQAVEVLRQRLRVEEERQVVALRAEIDALGFS